jgi:NAD(P)-dependent dehydrogenase (short-subunit alcohol dehydrogenase family)
MELQGKVAPVTGAGSGIGAPTALFFPREEAKVGALSHIVGEVRERVRD